MSQEASSPTLKILLRMKHGLRGEQHFSNDPEVQWLWTQLQSAFCEYAAENGVTGKIRFILKPNLQDIYRWHMDAGVDKGLCRDHGMPSSFTHELYIFKNGENDPNILQFQKKLQKEFFQTFVNRDVGYEAYRERQSIYESTNKDTYVHFVNYLGGPLVGIDLDNSFLKPNLAISISGVNELAVMQSLYALLPREKRAGFPTHPETKDSNSLGELADAEKRAIARWWVDETFDVQNMSMSAIANERELVITNPGLLEQAREAYENYNQALRLPSLVLTPTSAPIPKRNNAFPRSLDYPAQFGLAKPLDALPAPKRGRAFRNYPVNGSVRPLGLPEESRKKSDKDFGL